MKISFFCKNKDNPAVKDTLSELNGENGPFGALSAMSKTFGVDVTVAPQKEVMEQYGGLVSAEIAGIEKMPAAQFVETIGFIAEEISEQFQIPAETILFRVEKTTP